MRPAKPDGTFITACNASPRQRAISISSDRLLKTQKGKKMEMKSTISEGNELRPPSPFVEEEKHKNENNPKHYIGREARNRFWELFKSSNKKKDDQVNVTSAAGEYIRRIEKMKLLPEPLGIARLKGQVQNIDLKLVFMVV